MIQVCSEQLTDVCRGAWLLHQNIQKILTSDLDMPYTVWRVGYGGLQLPSLPFWWSPTSLRLQPSTSTSALYLSRCMGFLLVFAFYIALIIVHLKKWLLTTSLRIISVLVLPLILQIRKDFWRQGLKKWTQTFTATTTGYTIRCKEAIRNRRGDSSSQQASSLQSTIYVGTNRGNHRLTYSCTGRESRRGRGAIYVS